jgi:hypothetical protein
LTISFGNIPITWRSWLLRPSQLQAGMGRPALSQSLTPSVSANGFIGINLELLDQTAEFGGSFDQLLRCFLRIAGAARCTFRRLRHA